MKTTRIKTPITAVCTTTRTEAEQLVNEVATGMNQRRQLLSEADDAKLAIDNAIAPNLVLIEQGINARTEMLRTWAEANPAEFGKLKSIQFTSGTLGFRTGTPKLKTLKGWTWEKVLDACQRLIPKFVREKPEIDKEGIIAERESLGSILEGVGVKVVQDETFYVEPNLTETETRATTPAKAA